MRIPVPTVRNWVRGYRYPTGGGMRRARPIVMLPRDGDGMALSFINLMEVVSLAGFREQGVSMQKLRKAIDYVARHMQIDHPLASQRILTDGVELFWEYQERARDEIHLVNIVRGGQKVFSETVMRYLHEIEWGRDDFATRWWPGSGQAKDGPVVVDPRRAFGSPVLVGTGIRTEDVFLRFSAGEPITEIADDYGLTFEQTEAALRAEARFLEAQAA